jgi:hypothetical protein
MLPLHGSRPHVLATTIYHVDALAVCERDEEDYAEYQQAASMPDLANPTEYNASLYFSRSTA